MNKNHFFFGYAGNKRREVKNILESITDLSIYKTIVEPFCGSCAFSYYLSSLYPKKFKYVLNDNNKHLIELLKISRNKEKFDELIKKMNQMIIDLTKEKYNEIAKKDELESWIIKNSIYTIRAGLFPLDYKNNKDFSKLEDCDIIKFLRNEDITISNEDGIKIIESYANDKKALIFLDPPYLNSCNCFYSNPKLNIYEYLYNNPMKKYKCFCILALEDNWIIRLLFLKHKFISYDKMYEMSKKKTQHVLIINKN